MPFRCKVFKKYFREVVMNDPFINYFFITLGVGIIGLGLIKFYGLMKDD